MYIYIYIYVHVCIYVCMYCHKIIYQQIKMKSYYLHIIQIMSVDLF